MSNLSELYGWRRRTVCKLRCVREESAVVVLEHGALDLGFTFFRGDLLELALGIVFLGGVKFRHPAFHSQGDEPSL